MPDDFQIAGVVDRKISVNGVELKADDLVSIHPKCRADALEQDAEGKIHLALVLQGDPLKMEVCA